MDIEIDSKLYMCDARIAENVDEFIGNLLEDHNEFGIGMSDMPTRRWYVILLVILIICSLRLTAISGQEPNVGTCRIDSFLVPGQVSPDSMFTVSVDVEWALHGRPDNATIRAAIYEGSVDLNNPIWQSQPAFVSEGGEKVWDANLTAPHSEGPFILTAYAFYLDNGAWIYYKSNNTLNGPGFKQAIVNVTKTASLDVEVGSPGVSIYVDNVTLETTSNGAAEVNLFLGSSHEVSVPQFVEFQNSTRLAFIGWSDGDSQLQRNVTLNENVKLTALYKIQYLLQVNSLTSTSSEWYDAGSSALLQTPNDIPMSAPLNFLGVKYDFVGWTGAINSSVLQPNITMDQPKTVTANYSVDYSSLLIPAIITVGICGAGAVYLAINRKKTSVESEKTESSRKCGKCGEPAEDGWTYCNNCGASLESDLPKDK
jgi:zinc ribbon protein/List-Bact-rpt repeat protein